MVEQTIRDHLERLMPPGGRARRIIGWGLVAWTFVGAAILLWHYYGAARAKPPGRPPARTT